MFAALKKNKTLPGMTAICLEIGGATMARVNFGPERRSEHQDNQRNKRTPILESCAYLANAGNDSPEKTLARLSSEYDLAHASCTTLLDSSHYKLIMTETPEVNADELAGALRWRVKDLVDTPIEQLTLDSFNAPDSGGTAMTYAVAANSQAIRQLVNHLTTAKVNLTAIDIEEMAQRNIAKLVDEDSEGVALLRLYPGGGLITITRNGELYFSRKLNTGVESLQIDNAATIDAIILEIQRTMDYYERQFRQAPIKQLYISALPEPCPELHQAIAEELSITAKELNLENYMQCATSLPKDWQTRHFITIGAALRVEDETA